MNRRPKSLVWALLASCAVLFYCSLGQRALWNGSEGHAAEVAREMLEQKSWLTPRFNYTPTFDTPPFFSWLLMSGLIVVGDVEWALRFWPATFGLLTVFLTYLFGKRWKGEPVGLFAGAILATTFLFFGYTQWVSSATVLAFWYLLCFYALGGIFSERIPDRQHRAAMLFATALAGVVWTGGIWPVLFPVGVFFLTLLYTRLSSQVAKIGWQEPVLLGLLFMAPWFVITFFEHPSFLQSFFAYGGPPQPAPLYLQPVVLVLGFLPWSVFLPAVLAAAFRHRAAGLKRDPVKAMLVIASLGFLFAPHLVTVLPAIALLCGELFEEHAETVPFPSWIAGGLLTLAATGCIAIVILKLPWFTPLFSGPLLGTIHTYGSVVAFILAVHVMIAIGVWHLHRTTQAVGGLLLAQALFFISLGMVSSALDGVRSHRDLGRLIAARAQPGDVIAQFGVGATEAQTLSYYGHRPNIHVTAAEEVLQLPVGAWVVTPEPTQKSLMGVAAPKTFEPVGRQGQLVLLRKVK